MTAPRGVGFTFTVEFEEDQRQAVILALAHLAVERPGWFYYMTSIALKLDESKDGVPVMFNELYQMRKKEMTNCLPDDPTTEAGRMQFVRALAKYDE